MNPIINLKRPSPTNYRTCIICQQGGGKGGIRNSSTYGVETLKKAASKRLAQCDRKNQETIERILELDTENSSMIVWHKICYATFSDINKIARLKSPDQSLKHETTLSPAITCKARRSTSTPVNWGACIFCQLSLPKEQLHAVMTMDTSSRILKAAPLDNLIGSRLAGVHDLIAAEAKYHLSCYSAFQRMTKKTQHDSETDADVPMTWLCTELQRAADNGHALRMCDVWDRYTELAKDSGNDIMKSYESRPTTFRQKLQSRIGDFITFVKLDECDRENKIILIPSMFTGAAISKCMSSVDEQETLLTIPRYEPDEDIYMSLVHVALKLRGDLKDKPGHSGFGVSEENALKCIPDSLYMFLRLLYGGPCQLEPDADENEHVRKRVVSTAQDIIYGVSGRSKWTPKHIGLASTLHQVTRSKELVQMFNEAGHILSYHQIQQLDTALAEKTLQSMDPVSGSVIPPNLVQNKFVHFTADNIDILEETLDGKGTFHATQMAAWQRGSNPLCLMLDNMTPSTRKTLDVPSPMESLITVKMPKTRAVPIFAGPVEQVWYQPDEQSTYARKAKSADIAFNILRQKSTITSSWTVFNESRSTCTSELTTVGYMPIIQAPAHEFDTLNTVVKRCMEVSSHIGQAHTVLTVDQALYSKLMELKWTNPDYHIKLVPRLGGLHISMNFLKVIGQHMKGTGLAEAWLESGILGRNTIEQAMAGKVYNKAMRTHKITLQALWRQLIPDLLLSIQTADTQLFEDILNVSADADMMIQVISTPLFTTALDAYVKDKMQQNVNFSLWWGYMEMVSILLMFARAHRDGLWDLHLHSFSCMLPFFLRYDHYNYGRWGPVYLAEMKLLPEEILTEFQLGNFVIKGSERKFNQVDPDQAQEWLNGTGKRGGGIVGITRSPAALSRWALSYNMRSQIAADTRDMFQISNDTSHHNESKPARQLRDNTDEETLRNILKVFGVLIPDVRSSVLQNIAKKDLATDTIQDSLLNAKNSFRYLQENLRVIHCMTQ